MSRGTNSILPEKTYSARDIKTKVSETTQADKFELWVTKADLEAFKQEIVKEIGALLDGRYPTEMKKWLKSYEVRKLLNLSPGTLQSLRSNGTLPYTKIGGILLYEYKDIQKMLDKFKKDRNS